MMPLREDSALVADPGAQPIQRLQAAQRLIDLGRCEGVVEALGDLARRPQFAAGLRKFGLYVNFVAHSLRWLDFAGKQARQENAGRWETLDGSSPDPTGKTGSGVLLWVRPGATRVVVVFSNVISGFGSPMRGWVSMVHMHRALKPADASIVYVMGDARFLHFAGVRGLGENYDGNVARLRSEFEARRWSTILTAGESSGGYSALRFGLDLEARGVLSFSGCSSLAPADCSDRRLVDLQQQLPEAALDLLPLYRARERRPRVLLSYGAGHAKDTWYAERMADVPGCELFPLADFAEHGTMIECMRRKQMQPLVQRLLACS
jgi:hypothetical protein